MEKYDAGIANDEQAHSAQVKSAPPNHEIRNDLSARSALFLERSDTIIYAIVGACFLIGAAITLGYTFWEFGTQIMTALSKNATDDIAQAIIQFVSDLLLVLMRIVQSHRTNLYYRAILL